jgi:hypothetical protein
MEPYSEKVTGGELESPPRFWNDLWALWVSPSRLFASLRESPRSRLALLLLLALVTAATILTLDVLLETIRAKGAAEAGARGGGEEALRFLGHPAMRVGIVLLAPATLLLVLVAHAGAAYLLLMLTGGVEEGAPFAGLFRVVVWAKLVEVPRMLLWVPLVLAKRDAEVYFGPAALFSGDAESRLVRVLGAFDLFSLWFLVLVAIGTAVVLRVSSKRAAGAVFGPWVLWQAVKAAASLP